MGLYDDAKGTVKLRKTGTRALMNGRLFPWGRFSRHQTMGIDINENGLLESCYDLELSKELMVIAERMQIHDSIGFTCGVNYLLMRKVGIGTKLNRAVGLARAGSLSEHMQQMYDRYIPADLELSINIAYKERTRLVNEWTWIMASQTPSNLLQARREVNRYAQDALAQSIGKLVISKRLAKTLDLRESKTDQEVMRRLKLMRAPVGSYA